MERDFEGEQPVKAGDQITAVIDSFGRNNDPVFRVDGFVIFLKTQGEHSLEIGNEVEVKITKVLSNFGFAELI